MRILPVMSKFNHNVSNLRNSNKLSVPNFGDNNPSEQYVYIPQEPYSPERQAIENNYGKKLAQLANLAEEISMPHEEYMQLRAKIERERELEIKLLNNKYIY